MTRAYDPPDSDPDVFGQVLGVIVIVFFLFWAVVGLHNAVNERAARIACLGQGFTDFKRVDRLFIVPTFYCVGLKNGTTVTQELK